MTVTVRFSLPFLRKEVYNIKHQWSYKKTGKYYQQGGISVWITKRYMSSGCPTAELSLDEINLCLVFSNLLENAIQASVKTAPARRKINVEVYPHHNHLLLIHVENTFDGKIQQKNNIFQSSKRSGNGIGIESVRHITDKNGGTCDFTYEDGIFSAKIMLRI